MSQATRDGRTEDPRPGIFLSKKGIAYTIIGGSRRPYAGPEFSVSKELKLVTFDQSTTTHSDAWYLRRYNFTPSPLSQSERASYPKKSKPLTITESGRFRGPNGGDLRIRQPAIRAAEEYEKDPEQGMVREARPSDKWLNSVGSYPTSFSSLLPRLKLKSPKLLTSELFERWAELRTDGIEDPARILEAWDANSSALPPTQEEIDTMSDYEQATAAVTLAYPDMPADQMKVILEKAALDGVNIADTQSVLAFVKAKTTQSRPPVEDDISPPPPADTTVEVGADGDTWTLDPTPSSDSTPSVDDMLPSLRALAPGVSDEAILEQYASLVTEGTDPSDTESIKQAFADLYATTPEADDPTPPPPPVSNPDPIPYDALRAALGDTAGVLSTSDLEMEWDKYSNLMGGDLDDEDMLHFIEATTTRTGGPIVEDQPDTDEEEPYAVPDLSGGGGDEDGKALVPYTPPADDDESNYSGLIPSTPATDTSAPPITTTTPATNNNNSRTIMPGDIILVARF